MRIGVVQFAPLFGRVEENRDRAFSLARSQGADLWVFPELFATGYQFLGPEEALRYAEPVPNGPTARALVSFARAERCWVAAGLAELDGGRVFNSACLAGPGGLAGCYRKTHLFDREKEWAAPGDTGFPVWDTGTARVGLMICFDWRFPEAARTLALRGAEVLLHPANLIYPQCQEAMRVRSLENRVFTATANRVGTERRGDWEPLVFTGRSQITGADGEILVRLGDEEEGARVVEVDPARARDKRQRRNDFFADRRPDLYELGPAGPRPGRDAE